MGPLRGTSVEVLLPTVLEGLAITELPEFVATQYFRENQLEPVLTDWRLTETGLYFVTPTARARPAKVSVLADFLITRLANAPWSAEVLWDGSRRCGARSSQKSQDHIDNPPLRDLNALRTPFLAQLHNTG